MAAPASAAWPDASGAAPRADARALRVWPWVLGLVGGIVLAACGVGLYVASAVSPLLGHTGRATPLTTTQQLASGTYDVYEASAVAAPTLEPSQVTVVGPGGGVPTALPVNVFTITSGGTPYQSVVEFDAVRGGTYRIRVASPGGEPVFVFVAPSLTSALTRGLGYLALVAVGGIVALVSLILLIVRSVQRSRRRRAAPPVPPGVPRCANGHATGPQDRFCATCGTPVPAAPATAWPS